MTHGKILPFKSRDVTPVWTDFFHFKMEICGRFMLKRAITNAFHWAMVCPDLLHF